VVPLVFKTSVGREERPGCVRFAHASANKTTIATPSTVGRQTGRSPGGNANPMRLKTLLTVLLSCVLLVGVTGCAAVDKALTPPPKIKHVSIEATVAVPDAQVVGSFGQGKPSGLPLWPGATVAGSRIVRGNGGTRLWSGTLTTADPYAKVVVGLENGFQNAGWSLEVADASTAEASSTVLTVSSSKIAGVVTLSSQPDQTTKIEYLVSAAK
jgi:hypothetical protein